MLNHVMDWLLCKNKKDLENHTCFERVNTAGFGLGNRNDYMQSGLFR